MIVDVHAHVVAPPELYAYKALIASHLGYHGKGKPEGLTEAKIREYALQNIKLMDEVGTDMQLISPRPFQMMHSQKPDKVVHWWCEAVNDVIGAQCRMFPDRLGGVAGLPQAAGSDPKSWLPELERCVNDLGFVGILINPDPHEGVGYTPTMGDEYWYPLYEKMVELDVPALIHSAGCCNPRESYASHFITEGSIAVLSLLGSNVFKDFPTLKIIANHGGGSVPYQIGRWRSQWVKAGKGDFDEALRQLYFETCLWAPEPVEYLLRIVGPDRCMFGTERPGSGTAQTATGKWMDDLKPDIEGISWLTEAQREQVFHENARKVFTRLKVAER